MPKGLNICVQVSCAVLAVSKLISVHKYKFFLHFENPFQQLQTNKFVSLTSE